MNDAATTYCGTGLPGAVRRARRSTASATASLRSRWPSRCSTWAAARTDLGLVVRPVRPGRRRRGAVRRRARRPGVPPVMMQGSAAAAAMAQGVAALALIGGWSSLPLLAVIGMADRRPRRAGQPELLGDHPADRAGRRCSSRRSLAPPRPERRADPRRGVGRADGGAVGQWLGARARRRDLRGRRGAFARIRVPALPAPESAGHVRRRRRPASAR